MQSGQAVDEGVYADSLRLTLGFACNQGFLFSLFYLGMNCTLGDEPYVFERVDLVGVLLFMVFAFIVLRAASPRARDALFAVPSLWCYAVLIVLGSLVFELTGGSIPAIIVESVLVGICWGFLLAAWGRVLGSRPSRQSIRSVFVATALAALVCLAIAAIPNEQARLVLELLPLGSAFALQGYAEALQRGMGDEAAAEGDEDAPRSGRLRIADLIASREERDQALRLSRKIIAGTVVFGIAAGFMETFASEPGMQAMPAFPATLILLVLFCIAALQLIDSGGFDEGEAQADSPDYQTRLDSVYRLAILVMMAGFLFVPTLESFGVTGESIVLAGYLGLSCVLVCLFLVMSRIRSQDAALSFAQGFSALYAGELIGILLGNCIEFLQLSGSMSYTVAACAGLAALFAYLFLFTEQDFRELSVIVRQVDRFDDACARIAQEYSLSKREAEILPLALKGRTGERIASELFISKSTVDTHLRRIYSKTGTHGRQELIDLGERTVKELSQPRR